MQRTPSYYARKSFAAVLAGAAGLVVGMQIETNHASQHNPASYFVMQAYASDAFVQFVSTPSLLIPGENRMDLARECGAGIDTDCTYL